MTSWVWKYFDGTNKSTATCKVIINSKECGSILQRSGGTKGLAQHLIRIHKISKEPQSEITTTASSSDFIPAAKRQTKISDFLKRSTLDKEIAQLVAVDNFSFNQIAKSSLLQWSLKQKYPAANIPKTAKMIAKNAYAFYEKAQEGVVMDIDSIIAESRKFSASIDEWSSIANNRYVNINLHYCFESNQKYINLGLVKIEGSCPASELTILVRIAFILL